jgi:glucose-6-phosphate-specific signal transduction histidine kinase
MGKIKSWFQNSLLQGIAIAATYAAVYVISRELSQVFWALTIGLRLSALLIVPYRYWPALVIGEFIPIAYADYLCLNQLGWLWVVMRSFPPILLATPIVWWFRSKQGLFPSQRIVKVQPLLLCVGVVATLFVFVDFAILLIARSATYHFHASDLLSTLVGELAGILTIVPLALCYKLRDVSLSWKARVKSVATNRLTLDVIVVLLPTLLALLLMSRHAQEDSRQVIRILMFVPVGWLTLKHGWRAASFGTAIVMTGISLNLAFHPSTEIIQLQAFICFATVSLLVLGARTSNENLLEERERLEARDALKLAQQGLYLCEVRMRQTSYNLEQIAGSIQVTHNNILRRFRHMISLTESQNFFRLATATNAQIYQLADSLHPISWREKGLPSALRETIGRTLDEQGFVYRCKLEGRGLSQLSPGVHSAIYRFACEAAVYACENFASSHVYLDIRGGLSHGQRWVVVRVEGKQELSDINDPLYRNSSPRQLASKLGTQGFGLNEMRSYARLFDGDLHVKTAPDSLRITALLHDVKSERQEDRSPQTAIYLR